MNNINKAPPNAWMVTPPFPIDKLANNVILFDEPILMVAEIKQLWELKGKEGVLNWFWNDTSHG